jgi:hypothetical protein
MTLDTIIRESIKHRIEKQLNLDPLQRLAEALGLEIHKAAGTGKKPKKKTKRELIGDILSKFETTAVQEQIQCMKDTKAGFELEVKLLLDVDIDAIIKAGVCLPLHEFLEAHPGVKSKFTNACDLKNVNDTIKSSNCMVHKVQGLYILVICKDGVEYIVKLGSFAESQGMFERIKSFGGGNYETGSATNKWFQRFIKKALAEGYTSRFMYYNKLQEKILISGLDDEQLETIPYVIRQLETNLFKKYNESNSNIPPIFGSNCL